MKITVKLDPALESALRSRSAALGISASAVVREALQAYLSQTESPTPSACELGATVFGRYAGPPDLATQRKKHLRDALVEKQASHELPAKQLRHGKAPRA
jgi:plasmid stability protein